MTMATASERPMLYLIDGSSYIYRAYYAIRHLSSPKGFPTNALYGFTQMLLKVLKERRPDHVAVVFGGLGWCLGIDRLEPSSLAQKAGQRGCIGESGGANGENHIPILPLFRSNPGLAPGAGKNGEIYDLFTSVIMAYG